jgi:hypothetical protein
MAVKATISVIRESDFHKLKAPLGVLAFSALVWMYTDFKYKEQYQQTRRGLLEERGLSEKRLGQQQRDQTDQETKDAI